MGRENPLAPGVAQRVQLPELLSRDFHGLQPVTNSSPKPSSTLQNHMKHDICGTG
jgi:hypothetical protein